MFNEIISFVLVLPQIIFSICLIIFIIGSLYSVLYFVFKQSDILIMKLGTFFEIDSQAWNASIITNFLYMIMNFLNHIGLVSGTNVSITSGMATITSLWYIIYKIDVLYTMYREKTLNKDMKRKK